MLKLYRVHMQSGSPYPATEKAVLVVAENMKDAEGVVMRKAGSLFTWSSKREITQIELVPGKVLVGSPVAHAAVKEESTP